LHPTDHNVSSERTIGSEPGASGRVRQVLSDQADAILASATALVALDRRDLDAPWQKARAAQDELPRPIGVWSLQQIHAPEITT